MKDIYVINCCRTAIGSFGGTLKGTPAAERPRRIGGRLVRGALLFLSLDRRDGSHHSHCDLHYPGQGSEPPKPLRKRLPQQIGAKRPVKQNRNRDSNQIQVHFEHMVAAPPPRRPT